MDTLTSPKESAVEFLRLAAAGQVDEAFSRFVGQTFRHHNPHFAGDAQSLKAGMRENAARFPHKIFEVQRTIAEGPLVAVHSRVRMQPDSSSIAVVHVFRFEGQKIVELWDIGQPEPATIVNQHGMF
ncbi:nuclear transport factor 2 family protein [Noviherbaspirillum sp. UKPF54]|uniref:nuclear transport factor 2 family protein n=1 Tax=Noviherbaspirillum sp. UKPF54 TaxID=2601898 RepID=UPI0011B0F7D1|nr:nuclear transport factor 2 family protein [Noviherbaspirillum sp. UKPF54]QDZ26763.1 nuclear transport factor 2 family protein [Noviherbaspirillum sp. UKPF54]